MTGAHVSMSQNEKTPFAHQKCPTMVYFGTGHWIGYVARTQFKKEVISLFGKRDLFAKLCRPYGTLGDVWCPYQLENTICDVTSGGCLCRNWAIGETAVTSSLIKKQQQIWSSLQPKKHQSSPSGQNPLFYTMSSRYQRRPTKSWTQTLNDTCQRAHLEIRRLPVEIQNGHYFTTFILLDSRINAWAPLGSSGGKSDEQSSREEAASAAITTLQRMEIQIFW